MLKVRQLQCLGNNIQLEFAQLGQKILGEDQCIRRCQSIGKPLPFALTPDKPGIKIRVMGHKNTIAHEFQEFGKNLFNLRRTHQHTVGNAGELNDFRIQGTLRIHKGLEAVNFFPTLH